MSVSPRHDESARSARNAMLWVLIALAFLPACGCAHAMYNATALPPEFHARSLTSARHLDLNALSSQGGTSEELQVGDSVDVTIATGIETGVPPKYSLRVSDEGWVDVPLVGPVPVAGLTSADAEARIRDEGIRRGIYVSPKVNVAIAARRTYRITVSGAVNEPGTYDIPANACDVLAALTRARGLSEDADTIVEVRHPPTFQTVAQTVGPDGSIMPASAMQPSAQDRMRLDMTRVEALPREQLRLHDGSVVMVSRHPRRMVNVLGLVRNPTAVTIPAGEDLMLLDAIAQAGGTTISFADRVQVVRRVADKPDPVVIEASLRGARSGTADNMKLAPGDVVSVEETPATLVVDTIRTFFRVGFSAAIPGF